MELSLCAYFYIQLYHLKFLYSSNKLKNFSLELRIKGPTLDKNVM